MRGRSVPSGQVRWGPREACCRPRDPTHEVPAEDLGSHGASRQGAGRAAKRAETPAVAWQP